MHFDMYSHKIGTKVPIMIQAVEFDTHFLGDKQRPQFLFLTLCASLSVL